MTLTKCVTLDFSKEDRDLLCFDCADLYNIHDSIYGAGGLLITPLGDGAALRL
ncbi:hypothetical protein [Leptothrix discophora]|uniref:Uncharacterized protein n=1 Tax=Leptothrix discophora TaxID=89 RepID=A0ABT9G0D2_LEPDI|nr:hypothetical protein [Leptothrix discophora]MDP4299944.1 hypothetical protein [Leptothrix discophora]